MTSLDGIATQAVAKLGRRRKFHECAIEPISLLRRSVHERELVSIERTLIRSHRTRAGREHPENRIRPNPVARIVTSPEKPQSRRRVCRVESKGIRQMNSCGVEPTAVALIEPSDGTDERRHAIGELLIRSEFHGRLALIPRPRPERRVD